MHNHFSMQHVDSSQQLFQEISGLVDGERPVPAIEFVSEHLVAELKDAVDVFGLPLVVLEDVEQAHELLVVDELAKQGNFAHRGVVDSVGDVLNSASLQKELTSKM